MGYRYYSFRGFEIALHISLVEERDIDAMVPAAPRYRCHICIRPNGSQLRLDVMTFDYNGSEPFTDEFEAALYGCYAAERRINEHCHRNTAQREWEPAT
ncbi:hypothetical protein AAGS40_29860 (plasmid) [Paraburkholderia sp. PREW-6R]|uniref:hypothetical protein n=1 Tax=Paraburkholderia sp. PREW-6R TaxID=3141544 RepID=UPI0031F56AA2